MGTASAITIVLLWTGHLAYLLGYAPPPQWDNPLIWVHVLTQAYLYTGLFITAHDSMHGSISRNKKINDLLGMISLTLFAAFFYPRMFSKHMLHHQYPGTGKDPDFCIRFQDPLRWFIAFFLNYVTILQILIMAGVSNFLYYVLGIPVSSLGVFWILPAFLGTFQLFFFGTYLPHRYPHTQEMAPHNARSQSKNHLRAMVSCYFFGYHYEHHQYPRIPWWALYRKKI